jgi:hypothetical protein
MAIITSNVGVITRRPPIDPVRVASAKTLPNNSTFCWAIRETATR